MSTMDYAINPDRFKNFFNELETRRNLLTTITDLHTKLINHFASLDETLNKRSQILDSQIDKFKKDNEEALERIRIRKNTIPEKEVNLAARVEELKNSGIMDIEKGSLNSDEERKTISGLLRMYFRRMDSKGLMKFLLTNRKQSVALRAEMVVAAEEAVDLLAFVLEAMEEFVELKVSEEKVGGMADRRWACGILIQAALPMPAGGELSQLQTAGGGGVATSLKERAMKVLEKWRGVLGGGEGSGGVGSGEAIMFLQMVIGFRLKEKFDDEYLRNLVLEFASRRDMAKLAVALGFGDKMRDIIEELVKTGKEIEAVYFASEAGLTEQFPPVTLLKSCLRNCRKTANSSTSKDAHSSEDANSELIATRAIVKCVEDHKLESEFPIDNLKKRISHLEKVKADKKKGTAASTSKPSNKRPLVAATTTFRPPKAGRFSNTSTAFHQRNRPPQPTRQPSAAGFPAPYSYPSPGVYSSPTAASYGAGYGGAHIQSPARYGLQYAYQSQDIGAGGTPAGGSYGRSNYSVYDHNAPAATPPPYPATYNL